MRRKRRKQKEQIEVEEAVTDLVDFDEVLTRELDAPTVIQLDADVHDPPAYGDAVTAPVLTVDDEGNRLRPGVDSNEDDHALLRAELVAPPTDRPHTDRPPTDRSHTDRSHSAAVLNSISAPALTSTSTVAPSASVVTPTDSHPTASQPALQPMQPMQADSGRPIRAVAGFEQHDFWDRYEEATAAAELFAVPPAAITVVVGSLDVAIPVAERCQATHWVSECDVFVLSEQEMIATQPTWTMVRRPSDVVAVLEGGESDFPLIVIDIPRELPAWIRPLVERLRVGGVGLVHYVLGDDPSDEDLATWHGELGRPAVLDLASLVSPDRVLELLDRGEPVASVAGMPVSTELLLALRLNSV